MRGLADAPDVDLRPVPAEPRRPLSDALSEWGAAGTVLRQIAAFLIAIVLLVVGLGLLGYAPSEIVGALWDGSVGSSRALELSFNQAAPLVLTGTAVWLAYQCGLFNIGADGQLQVGGLAAVAVMTELPADLPGPLLVVLGLVAAAVAGVVWSSVAAALRIWRGANEVVATIMLNFIAFRLVDNMMSGALRSSTAKFTPQSERIPESAELHGLFGTPVTLALVIALAIAVAAIATVNMTTIGLRLRGIGLNDEAAAHAGVPVAWFRLIAFSSSGALAGLAGGVVILGLRYMLAPGWAISWGFSGILIAFLALRTPLLIPFWAIVFGMLASAGPQLKAKASVPDAIVLVMQTLPVVVLFVLVALIRLRRSRRASRVVVGVSDA